MSSKSPHRSQPEHFITETLSPVEHSRLTALYPEGRIEKILTTGAVIAGGTVLYALLDIPTADIDVFIRDATTLRQVLDCVDTLYPDRERQYFRHHSTISIHIAGCLPIQCILKACETAQDIIADFDLDYVQCAVTRGADGSFLVTQTEWAVQAQQTKTITMIQDFPYMSCRLRARLRKAERKGFKLACPLEELGRCGVTTRGDDWLNKIRREEPRRLEPVAYSSLVAALEEPLLELVRANYDDIPEPHRQEAEKAREKKLHPRPFFIRLRSALDDKIEDIRRRMEREPFNTKEERRLFYLERALVLAKTDPESAIASATSDATKLAEGREGARFDVAMIALGGLFLGSREERGELTTAKAVAKIERLLGV